MDWLALTVSAVGAVAAVGAWLAAWYPNRFRRSWVLEPQSSARHFLVRNNTNRVAHILSVKPTPLHPDSPDKKPTYATDEPANASIEPGEAFGIRVTQARSVIITWELRRWWWFKRKHSGEWTVPIKYI